MPRFIVHVGPHKTGTTYLQQRLAAMRPALRARGVLFPEVWSASEAMPSQLKLVVALRTGDTAMLRATRDAVLAQRPDTVLVSAEGISHLRGMQLQRLGDLIGCNPVTIVFYCRRWCELLPSVWQECVKHGDFFSLEEFVSREAARPFDSDVMNFAAALDRYEAVFGGQSIQIVSYSNLVDSGRDLVEHFFQTFLPDHQHIVASSSPAPSARPNRSLPPVEVEIIRALNAMNAEQGAARGPALRVWYQRQRRSLDPDRLEAILSANLRAISLSDQEKSVEQLHAAIESRFGSCMLPPRTAGRLFTPRNLEAQFVDSRYTADPVARSELDRLFQAYRRHATAA